MAYVSDHTIPALNAAAALTGAEFVPCALAGGDATITTTQAIANLKNTYDLIDIREFGGVADGVTSNVTALTNAKASAPAGAIIWFKNRGTGVYTFTSTDYANLFADCVLYVEDGVIMEVSNPNFSPLEVLTPTTFRFYALAGQIDKVYPKLSPAIKNNIQSTSLEDSVVVRTPILSSEFVEREVDWPIDGITTDGANLSIINDAEIDILNIAGTLIKSATLVPVAGESIYTFFDYNNISDSSFPILWVENSWGYGIFHDSSVGITFQWKEVGVAVTYDRNTTDPVTQLPEGSYYNYKVQNSVVGLKLHDDGINFELICNGVNRFNKSYNLGGLPITRWGFGGYSNIDPVTIKNSFREYTKKVPSQVNPTIQIFGDSQGVSLMGKYWGDYLYKYLVNSYGYRIVNIENYSISGQTVEQQKSVFDGVTHNGVTIFLAGTNNIQGQTSVANMITAFTDILTAVGADNLIICVPPMFFSQTLNSGQGQASSNYELGGAYRSAILRFGAENGVTVVDLPSEWGFTNASSYLMCDDIHPADTGAAITGLAVAKAYLNLVNKVKLDVTVIGDSNSALRIMKEGDTPATPATPDKWVDVYLNGTKYQIPLYL